MREQRWPWLVTAGLMLAAAAAIGRSTYLYWLLRAGSTADVPVCLKLSLVLDQRSGEVPARDADRLIKWFIGLW